MFCRPDGNPLSPGAVSTTFRTRVKAAQAAGLELRTITLHGLRHTFVTLNIKAGVPSPIISERAGHHGHSYTVDTYGHIDVDAQRDAALAIQDVLRGVTPTDVRRNRDGGLGEDPKAM